MAEPRAIGKAAPRRLIDDADHTHGFTDGEPGTAKHQVVVRTQGGDRLAHDPESAAGLDRPAHHGVCASGPAVVPTAEEDLALETSWAGRPRLLVEPRSTDILVAQVCRHSPLWARRAGVVDRQPLDEKWIAQRQCVVLASARGHSRRTGRGPRTGGAGPRRRVWLTLRRCSPARYCAAGLAGPGTWIIPC